MDAFDSLFLQSVADDEAEGGGGLQSEMDWLSWASALGGPTPAASSSDLQPQSQRGFDGIWNDWVAHTHGDQLMRDASNPGQPGGAELQKGRVRLVRLWHVVAVKQE